jgi:hypothetical protein
MNNETCVVAAQKWLDFDKADAKVCRQIE